MASSITFLSGATETGFSATFTPDVREPTEIDFHVWGTLGGGTVGLYQSPDGGTSWVALAAVSTNPGRVRTSIIHDGPLRAALAGGEGPYNVTCRVFGVGLKPVTSVVS